jgi:predicted TIM-barrel fold metal-dependent hydrolase
MKILSAIAVLLMLSSANAAAEVTFSQLYYDGEIVGTLVPPAAAPMAGTDPVYPIFGGVDGQLPVAGVGPGDTGYHGGHWAVHVVMWNMDADPYLLTSAEDVWNAYYDGDLSITRVMEADFKCPLQRKPKN